MCFDILHDWLLIHISTIFIVNLLDTCSANKTLETALFLLIYMFNGIHFHFEPLFHHLYIIAYQVHKPRIPKGLK